jgi:hypothetical protein
VEGIRDLN